MKFKTTKTLAEMTGPELDRAIEEAGARGDRARLDEIQAEIARRKARSVFGMLRAIAYAKEETR